MKIFACALFLGFSALLQGCSYPDPEVIEQQDIRPSIGISGAPEGSQLFVDGLHMGPAARYDGEVGVLLVESGKHMIEIKDGNGNVLQSEEMFLGNSTKKIIQYLP